MVAAEQHETDRNPGGSLEQWLPGLAIARRYRRPWLRGDVAAGLVLSALLVPQGMAYAQLAGLPPVTGLYATVLALLAYAVLGPSRTMIVGPDSSLLPLVAATVLPLVGAGADPTRLVGLASALALMVGLIAVAAGLTRVGTLAELISRPVRVGYLNGIALVIIASQLPRLFGFSVVATDLPGQLKEFVDGLRAGLVNPTALLLGLASLVTILVLRWRWPRLPGVLVAAVGATLAVSLLDLQARGVAVVGPIPSGFPVPALPSIQPGDLQPLLLGALAIAFVALTDTSALSRSLAARAHVTVDPNHEVAAIGAANVAAGLFQGFPVSASSSRTPVAMAAGAQTQLTGVIGAGVIVAVLLVGGNLLANFPSATLAAIVIVAGLSLLDLRTVAWLWRVRRSECLLSLAALAGVVLVGVLPGILVAVALSIGTFVIRLWRPYNVVLGRLGDRKGYHDVARHPDAEQVPGLLIYRFDAPLFFANADYFARQVHRVLAARGEPVRWLLVAGEPITDIDTTAAETLAQLHDDLGAQGITLVFAELKGPVKDRLRDYDLYDHFGGDGAFLPTLGSAINAYLRATGIAWTDRYEEHPATEDPPLPGASEQLGGGRAAP
ncbi:MAG: SulP family inorganic anion transporter [Candidatus Limnocylindrales bacterium]